MNVSGLIVALSSALSCSPPIFAANPTMPVEGVGDLDVAIVDVALLATEKGGKELSIVAEPDQPIDKKQARAVAGRIFSDYAMATAIRRGASKVTIYIRSDSKSPTKREVRERTSIYSARGDGEWALTNRWEPGPPARELTLKLEDGVRLIVESFELRRERLDGIAAPTLRAEFVLDGLNPMLERDVIYTSLADAWNQIYRAQAEEKGVRSVELVAYVEGRSAHYQVRDATVLQLVASDNGAFPPLPPLPGEELKNPSIDSPAGSSGYPEARFGHLDTSRFDQIVEVILTEPRGVTATALPPTPVSP